VGRKTFRDVVAALKSSPSELRGSMKLSAALDVFRVDVAGRTCLDVGASTGGFTTVLLQKGAARVYAVDAGHGQLLGSLRQDPRVVNLEATNVGDLTVALVPEPVDLVTVDVSYLSLREAVAQLDRIEVAPGAELVGLVKPMFELRLGEAPTDETTLGRATALAAEGLASDGWTILGAIASPVKGAKGAIEGFVHAQRSSR
jgi:23S rRNA (cytidine1920-2'-O)/16S rRNA (cytidine1409-2'-O)-methyltransferase